MAGSNYITQAQSKLDKLMNTPTPGMYSSGEDQLAQQYEQEVQSGMSNIASRGLTTTGAVPSLFTSAEEQFQSGTAGNIAQGQLANNQQKLQMLQSLLGIGQNALTQAKSGALSSLFTQGAATDILGGLIGKDTGFLTKGGIPGLLSWLGIGP